MRREYLLLVVLMVVTLAVRLAFAFQTPQLSGDGAYFTLRQVEHIRATGLPITEDPLSYGGREYFFQPLWYYVLAIPSLIFPPMAVLKVVPNICMALLMLFVFRLALRFSAPSTALAAAAITGWIPAMFQIINDASPIAFGLLLFTSTLEAVASGSRAWLRAALGIILLSLTHSMVILLALVLLVYLILLRTEHVRASAAERELTWFSLVFSMWITTLLFKRELLQHGLSVFWGMIPNAVLAEYFADLTILQAIGAVGYIPFLYGIYATLNTVFGNARQKEHQLLLSLLLVTSVALWLRAVPLRLGLPLFGIGLGISFGHFIDVLSTYLEQMRMRLARGMLVVVISVVVIASAAVPAVVAAHAELARAPNAEEVAAITWLREHTPRDAVVLASVGEGNTIAALAAHPTVADTQFHFAPNADVRYRDLKRIFTTPISSEAVALIAKYDVSYIYLSPKTREAHGGQGLAFLDANCFTPVYDQGVRIYAFRCRD